MSQPFSVSAGVLRGLVLGTIPFLLFFIDLRSSIYNPFYCFVDDDTFHCLVSCPNTYQSITNTDHDCAFLITRLVPDLRLVCALILDFAYFSLSKNYFSFCFTRIFILIFPIGF